MYIGVPEERLDRLRVLPGLYEKRRERVAEIVKSKPDRVLFLQHSRSDGRWSQMILNQHVGDARLFALERKAGKYPICHSCVGRRVVACSDNSKIEQLFQMVYILGLVASSKYP